MKEMKSVEEKWGNLSFPKDGMLIPLPVCVCCGPWSVYFNCRQIISAYECQIRSTDDWRCFLEGPQRESSSLVDPCHPPSEAS